MKYQHAEAFCLMKYECEKCRREEIIWNARDGVTPFMIPCTSVCDGMMKHIHWHFDKLVPDYLPERGQRVFVDLTPQIKEVFTRANVRAWWTRDPFPMKDSFATQMEAVEQLSDFTEGMPFLMTV